MDFHLLLGCLGLLGIILFVFWAANHASERDDAGDGMGPMDGFE